MSNRDEPRPESTSSSGQNQETTSKADEEELASSTTDNLRRNRLLWYKLHVFMYDLRNFRSKEASRARLDTVISLDYIGPPYFTDAEAQTLRSTTIDGGKSLQDILEAFFNQKLEARLERRANSEYDYKVCAAHDLAPLYEKAFGVKEGDLKRNKEFVKLVTKRGLHLAKGEVWFGMGSKASRTQQLCSGSDTPITWKFE
jgi:hypothetical protein